MKIETSFESYLEKKHAEQYCGLNDLMADNYIDWLEGLDNQEIINYAEELLNEIYSKD